MKKITAALLLLILLFTLASCASAKDAGTTEIAGEGEGDIADLAELDIISEPDIMLIGEAAEDPSVPPVFQAEYQNGEIAGCLNMGIYTYSWKYEDENGEANKEVDAVHPLSDPEIVTCDPEEGSTLTFTHSDKVLSYTVYMWREGADMDDCQVICPEDDTVTAEKNCTYMVSAEYENGSVDYAFKTV